MLVSVHERIVHARRSATASHHQTLTDKPTWILSQKAVNTFGTIKSTTMKVIDKTTNQTVTVRHPNTMKQFQNYFGCKEQCRGYCMESMKVEVWDKYNRREVRALCQLIFKNE